MGGTSCAGSVTHVFRQCVTYVPERFSIRLPHPWQETPANPGLILTIARKAVPEHAIFARCSRYEEDRAHGRGHQSPDGAKCEGKGQVGEKHARVAGVPNQSVRA